MFCTHFRVMWLKAVPSALDSVVSHIYSIYEYIIHTYMCANTCSCIVLSDYNTCSNCSYACTRRLSFFDQIKRALASDGFIRASHSFRWQTIKTFGPSNLLPAVSHSVFFSIFFSPLTPFIHSHSRQFCKSFCLLQHTIRSTTEYKYHILLLLFVLCTIRVTVKDAQNLLHTQDLYKKRKF